MTGNRLQDCLRLGKIFVQYYYHYTILCTNSDIGVVGVIGVPAAGVVEGQAVVALDTLGGGGHKLLRLGLFVLACTGNKTLVYNRSSTQNNN